MKSWLPFRIECGLAPEITPRSKWKNESCMIDCINEWMIEEINDACINDGMNGPMNQYEGMNEDISYWMIEWTTHWMIEEGSHEWMNESINVFPSLLSKDMKII